MGAAVELAMTVEEFFVWQQSQEERYELVEGVPARMMTGASTAHDRISGNIHASLHAQLRGSPCWPATADVGVRTRIRSLRRGDVIVICDAPRPDVYEAHDLKLVAEVLSPSNRGLDWLRKLEEYRQLKGLAYLLLVESETAKATLATRTPDGWTTEDLDGLEGALELPVIACRLTMADIYAGVSFDLPPA